MFILIMVLAAVGLILSQYIYSVEKRVKRNPDFKAACDFSDIVSCTKPIKSGFGKILGVQNSALGIFFYSAMILFAFFELETFIFWGSVAACLASVYFAYLLYFRIKSVCLICSAIYLVNFALLFVSFGLY